MGVVSAGSYETFYDILKHNFTGIHTIARFSPDFRRLHLFVFLVSVIIAVSKIKKNITGPTYKLLLSFMVI